jgi:ADP-heptose:LPS heptosyltransferase
MRIVALVPGGIGDQILFFPTLDDIKLHYPQSLIDVVIEPRSTVAYRVNKSVNKVIPFDYKDRNGLADVGNLLGIIRDNEYDIAISLGSSWAVSILLWLTGIPTRIGYKSTFSWLLTNSVPLKTEQYAAFMYHDLLMGLDINSAGKNPSLSIPKEDLEWQKAQKQRLNLDNGYVLIHGGSSQLSKDKGIDKIYPVPKWQQVINGIKEQKPHLSVVILAGPEDQKFVAELSTSVSNIKTISPPDIGKLAAMIADANVMLCTDSGPMHLSVGSGTKTIALFGPTKAEKLLPKSDRIIGIQSHNRSLSNISPDEILQNFNKLIS